MCSIFGTYGFEIEYAQAEQANASQQHRGPDNSAVVMVDNSCWIAHNRLAIIGLEAESNQPMASTDNQFLLVYNGEIYNYREIREDLIAAGHHFRTHSDTEVVLAAWSEWGADMLERFNGMFALAIYDRQQKTFFCARDRIGVKPFYFFHDGQRFAFASEIQALEILLGQLDLDPVSVDAYFMLGYIPGPKSIWKQIHKLQPGHFMQFNGESINTTRYWAPSYKHIEMSESEALSKVAELLQDAVRLRLRSDVPVGAFLSGGIDSSLIVANMKAIGTDTRTFTIGFDDPRYDESKWAKIVADQYSDHHICKILNRDSLVSLSTIAKCFGEPFADPSALPTYYVSEIAAQYVKVVLSGDGGDEMFMGYNKYRSFKAMAIYYRFPEILRSAFEKLLAILASTPMGTTERVKTARRILGAGYKNVIASEITKKTCIRQERRRTLHQFALDAEQWIEENLIDKSLDGIDQMISVDLNISLPDDMLVKVDRASMAHSIEVRNPFLDYRIIEFATSLSPKVKMPGMEPKHLLKKLAENYFPRNFVYRPKQGFVPPISYWLDKPLSTDQYELNSVEDYIKLVYEHFQLRIPGKHTG